MVVWTTFFVVPEITWIVSLAGVESLTPTRKRAWPCCAETVLASRSEVSTGGGPVTAGAVVVGGAVVAGAVVAGAAMAEPQAAKVATSTAIGVTERNTAPP